MLNIEKYKDEILNEYQQLTNKKPQNYSDGTRMNKAIKMIASRHCGKPLLGAARPFEWLCEEYKEPVLDDAEKKYLSAVIRPFRCDVKFISKEITFIGDRYRIKIITKQSFYGAAPECIILPSFEADMYKGMELGRKYTLEELVL